ncbi:MAG: hypothetical protein QOJ36_18 [Verrucomicrobiota bacterium]
MKQADGTRWALISEEGVGITPFSLGQGPYGGRIM